MSSQSLKNHQPQRRKAKGRSAAPLPAVPVRVDRTLRYVTKVSMNPGIGGQSAALFFSANGMYDPDRSLGGHQPYGFDEYMEMYNHFTVLRSRIMVSFMPIGTSSGRNANSIVAVGLRDTTTSTTTIEQFIEMGRGEWSLLGQQDGGKPIATLHHACDVSKYLGRPDLLSDPDCRGDATNDPGEEVFFEINAANLDGVDGEQLDLLVVLEFDAAFTEPKRILQS
jgi:hypothetical protein